ncbi:MAG: class II fructose-bisphosphate aldolase [Bacilli bacterium]
MLVNLNEIFKVSRQTHTAVGAINTPNLETLIAAISVAEKYNIPLIIAHAQLHDSLMKIEIIGPIMLDMAKKANVPVCVHLDHGESFEFCKKAIDLGFSSVMIDASLLDYEDNIAITKKTVNYAHARGVTVEAELGQLPNRESGDSGSDEAKSHYTDPKLVPDFVEKTGIDALAIAFGTAHGIYKTKPILNFDIIRQVRKLSNIPLVMHGGSGLQHADYIEAIKAGINKINYYTYMSYEGYAAAKALIEKQPTGFYHDICDVATKAEEKKLEEILAVFSNLTK